MMEYIFHEKQEGYLCAQHCLNALLQGQYFDAVSLADLASNLDQEERERMAENGEDTEDYKKFLEQPSGNMDDSGYFSVQVISNALKSFELELVPYTSSEPVAVMAREDPVKMNAYICNYKGHWFTIRKLGNQWFNLNSCLSGPVLLSDTYVAVYLAQLIEEGYSIFIVVGKLPSCIAEEELLKNPVARPRAEPKQTTSIGYRLGTREEEEAKIRDTAKLFEKVTVPSTSYTNVYPDVEILSEKPVERIIPIKIEGKVDEIIIGDEEDEELEKALQLSLQDNDTQPVSKDFQWKQNDHNNSHSHPNTSETEDTEDDELRRALQMSLECVTTPNTPKTPSQEEIRWRRLMYHNNTVHNNISQQGESSTKLNS